MHKLPKEWRRLKLKDCGIWLSGGTPATDEPRFWGGDLPWISAASLKDFRIADSDRRITRAGSMAGTRLVDQGSVLFVVRGMSLKTEFRVGVTQRRVAFGQDCKAITPYSSIDGKFLALALKARSRDILAMVDEAGHGTGRLPTDLLAKLEIGIPVDLREQRRIAEILDAVDEQVDSMNLVAGKVGLLRDSIALKDLDSLDVPKRPIGEIASVSSGSTPSRSRPDYWKQGGTPWVKTSEVNSSEIVATEESVSLEAVRDASLRIFPVGTVLVAMYGDGVTRGRVAMLGIPATVNQACAAIVCNRQVIRPEFLYMYLRHKYYALRNAGQGSNQANLSGEIVADFLVPVPSLYDQKNIVAALSASLAYASTQKRQVERFRLLKEGLLEDLLTGRVRVSV